MRPFLDDLVASGAASAAVGLVGTPERVEHVAAAGLARRPDVPATPSTRFDFASLTKPFIGTLALVLDASGRLPLDLRIGEAWPAADRRLARKTLGDLLRHRAGLAAWTPLYHRCRTPAEVVPLLVGGGEAGELLGARAGTYSDLDVMLWGFTAERLLGRPLARLLREAVLAPLGLARIAPSPGDRPDVAESLMDTAKEVELAAARGFDVATLPPPPVGLVQDGHARFLGGFAAHAGLFGRARDLWRLGAEWLAPGRLLREEAVAAALGGPHPLGWRRRVVDESAGPRLGRRAFGHTGFAGGSLWIDPDARRIVVLLAHRTAASIDMNSWRRRFHAVAYDL